MNKHFTDDQLKVIGQRALQHMVDEKVVFFNMKNLRDLFAQELFSDAQQEQDYHFMIKNGTLYTNSRFLTHKSGACMANPTTVGRLRAEGSIFYIPEDDGKGYFSRINFGSVARVYWYSVNYYNHVVATRRAANDFYKIYGEMKFITIPLIREFCEVQYAKQ